MSDPTGFRTFDYSSKFQHTEPPNPEFKPGTPVAATAEGREWMDGEKKGWKVVDTSTENPRCVCRFLMLTYRYDLFSA